VTTLADRPTIPFNGGDLIAGKYRVDRILGAGGMGVVVAATHVDLDRPVAVKLIREELASDPGVVERLMLEARSAAKIKSDHVGRVLDVGKLDNGVPYIVMEFLQGMDLCQMLEQTGPLSVMDAVDFVLQACEALAEAHLANIVHRDLKPENLFVTRLPDGSAHIKVLDFGISKQLGDTSRRQLTNPSSAVGSPQYMAPEQMQAREVDLRVDIWALGAILYELLSNHPAFEGSTLPEVCIKVMGQEPPQLSVYVPHIPDALQEIVTRCLTKDPDKRYAGIGELVDDLVRFGSARSAQSRNRIAGVLGGGTASGFTPAARELGRLGAGATAVATTPGSGLSVSVAQTAEWIQGQTTPGRQVSRWPVYLGMVGVVLVGVGLWLFTQNAMNEVERAPEPALAGTGPIAPNAELSVPPAHALPSALPAELATAEGTATGTPPEVLPVLEQEPEAPAPTSERPLSRTAKAKPKAPSKSTGEVSPPSNAWDTGNFGGRR
jgi:serine/threonine-protein kinase